MRSKPKVSVIMAVYNAENYLRPAIEGILNQTFQDFEFIIVNDGSTDNSIEIINSYKDNRIKSRKNQILESQLAFHICKKYQVY